MEIRPEYLQKYLYDIALDQLSDDYRTRGYEVTKEEKIGNARADLVAKKDGEVVVFEIKSEKLTTEKRQQISEIADYVRAHKNHKFLVVLATPPKLKKIAIPDLAQVLVNYLNTNYTAQLNSKLFAGDAQVLSVTNLVLNEATFEAEIITITGNALINVEFRYANNIEGEISEDDPFHEDALPCVFDLVLSYTSDRQLFVSTVRNLTIDTSDYAPD